MTAHQMLSALAVALAIVAPLTAGAASPAAAADKPAAADAPTAPTCTKGECMTTVVAMKPIAGRGFAVDPQGDGSHGTEVLSESRVTRERLVVGSRSCQQHGGFEA